MGLFGAGCDTDLMFHSQNIVWGEELKLGLCQEPKLVTVVGDTSAGSCTIQAEAVMDPGFRISFLLLGRDKRAHFSGEWSDPSMEVSRKIIWLLLKIIFLQKLKADVDFSLPSNSIQTGGA